MQNTRLTEAQISRLLASICGAESSLVSLNLSNNSMALVNPDLPASAAQKVMIRFLLDMTPPILF